MVPYVTDPIPMTNSCGGALYCLIFAGHNQTGATIAADIFGRHQRPSTRPHRRVTAADSATLPLFETG